MNSRCAGNFERYVWIFQETWKVKEQFTENQNSGLVYKQEWPLIIKNSRIQGLSKLKRIFHP